MNAVTDTRNDPGILKCGPSPDPVQMPQKTDDPDHIPGQSQPPGMQYGDPPPARNLSDEQLLDSYRRGDAGAFAKLVARYQRELFHFLVRFLGDRAAAEDIFQETFLQVHQSAAGFDVGRRFRPWLFTIAANKARDLLRSQARRPAYALQAAITRDDEQSSSFLELQVSGQELPSDTVERQEMAERVRATVMVMPDSLREILLLCYFEQFPYKQISEILDIPLGTVKSRLHTAISDFANRWKMANNTIGNS